MNTNLREEILFIMRCQGAEGDRMKSSSNTKLRILTAVVSAFVLTACVTGCAQKSETTVEVKDTAFSDNAAADAETEEAAEPAAEETEAEEAEAPAETEPEVTERAPGFEAEYESFTVSSEDLHDGVWDSVITNTDNGSNVSPQLSWEPVEGAEGYVIYMTDINAGNWMHWKSGFVTETELAQGAAEKDEYIGPYPPSGTHEYEIRVFALKKPVEAVRGAFDDTNTLLKSVAKKLDTDVDGNTGNILACGYISGTYTAGE